MDSLKQRRNGITINPRHSRKPKRDARGGVPNQKDLTLLSEPDTQYKRRMSPPAQNSVSNKNVTWLKTRDENVFHALLSRMGKSYQYRQFLKLCENPTDIVISDTINGPKKPYCKSVIWRDGWVFSYWSNPAQRMSVSVKVAYKNKTWGFVDASFAYGDSWFQTRKAVKELNERRISRSGTGPYLHKNLSRKPKLPKHAAVRWD
jgi:hypothetical protein